MLAAGICLSTMKSDGDRQYKTVSMVDHLAAYALIGYGLPYEP